MDPITIGLIAGAGKGLLDQRQEKKDRQTQSEIQRWSPWTGLQGQQVKGTNLVNPMMQGAMTGAMMGQGMGGAAAAGGGTGVEAGALGSGGVPMAPESQFYSPYSPAAPNAARDYTSPWMAMR